MFYNTDFGLYLPYRRPTRLTPKRLEMKMSKHSHKIIKTDVSSAWVVRQPVSDRCMWCQTNCSRAAGQQMKKTDRQQWRTRVGSGAL